MELFLTIAWAIFILATPLPISLYWATCLDGHAFQTPRRSIAKRALSCLTIWTFIQLCLPLVMGMLGMFRARYVLLAYVLILAICLSGNIRHKIITAICDNLFILTKEKISFQEATIVSLWMLLIVVSLAITMATPITNYDSQAYHLPNMATWLQYGRFKMVDSSLLFQVNRYPYSWEAFSALLLMPFRSDILVSLPSVFSQGLFWLAVYCLSRHFAVGRMNALFVAFLASSLPIEMELLNSVQVDTVFAAFCLIMVYAILIADRGVWNIIYWLAGAIIIGIKINGIFYVALLTGWGVAIAWLLSISSNEIYLQSGNNKLLARSICKYHHKIIGYNYIVIGSCCFVAGFWYVRNFMQIGNPFGYVPLTIGRLKLFAGANIVSFSYLKRTSLAQVMRCGSITDWRIMLDQLWHRFGLPFLIMLLLAAPSATYLMGGRNMRGKIGYLALAGLLVVASYLYWISPYSGASGSGDPSQWYMRPWFGWNLRYALFAIGLLAVLAAIGVESLALPPSIMIAATIGVCLYAISFVRGDPVGLALSDANLLLALALFFVAAGGCFLRRRLNVCSLAIYGMVFSSLVLCIYVPFADRARDCKSNDCYFGIPEIIARYTATTDKVGYAGLIRILPIFGPGLHRIAVDVSGKSSRYDEFVDFVKREELSCIVAQRQSNQTTPEIDWMLRDGFVLKRKISRLNGGHLLKDSLLVFCR